MKYRKLGKTEEDVSVICLGTMNWGEQNTEQDAHEQMDYAVSKGVNFFDTAEIYAIPPREETQGRTETYIGNWFKKTKKRDDIFLASKVSGPSLMAYMREWGMPNLDKKNITVAIEASLKRLQVDHIDLYQVHWPSRNTNFFGTRGYNHAEKDDTVSIEETLSALTDLIQEGKIRYIGLSNETPWGVTEWLRLSRENDMPRVVSVQNPYSLIMREYEVGMAEISIREQVGLLAYSPLAGGVLSGKYIGGKKPEGARFTLFERNAARYNPAEAQSAIEAYIDLAKKHNLDPAQMALSFVNDRQFVTSNIIGATTMEQLQANIDSVDLTLSEELLDEIATIHQHMPNPIA